MDKKFEKLVNSCLNHDILEEKDMDSDMILVDRGSFQLVIFKDNTEEHGYYFVNSIDGHDCYTYNSVSTHIYHIIDGVGKFVIDGESIDVKAGDVITIDANKVFAYFGKMIIMFEMLPDFKEENDHLVKKISYE